MNFAVPNSLERLARQWTINGVCVIVNQSPIKIAKLEKITGKLVKFNSAIFVTFFTYFYFRIRLKIPNNFQTLDLEATETFCLII